MSILRSPAGHWVGDGFPVRSLFTYDKLGQHLSPFLMLDYAGPAEFAPADMPRGVGEHPHRGFETVTIVYSGEVAHRDSTGGGGTIGPGDVQWMTAAAGILHDEFHSPAFTRAGGTLEMAQLWVNLPARHKMAEPRYQTIVSGAIPVVELPARAGRVRVIAGELVVLEQAGAEVRVDAGAAEAMILVLSGTPIGEPIVGHGPFVMNSREEIETAMNDFRMGKFGRMPADEPASRAGALA